ncbi:hypothetical protein LTR66_003472 [Elasticomyces elasticus]|nr:hypothetical protein LTR66_003472 [Elasticomyces elasticus]
MADHNVEEDDYMSMSFANVGPKAPESSLQRRLRKEKEGKERSRNKTKAERLKDEQAARDAALQTPLDATSKGAQMMAKLGFRGGALGKEGVGRTEPIELQMKADRGGIGMDSEKKRKVLEAMDGEVKKVKMEQGDYRERMAREKEQGRVEKMVWAAMKVTEGLDCEEETHIGDERQEEQSATEGDRDEVANLSLTKQAADDLENAATVAKPIQRNKPLKSINVLWRELAIRRMARDREGRMRFDLQQSLSRVPTYDDPEEDQQDKQAYGTAVEELEEDDPELDAFVSLDAKDRLAKIVEYLRERYHYCFWCKHRYTDEEMSECPGVTEDVHG